MGVTPAPENMNVDVAIAAFPWGAYLGEEALDNEGLSKEGVAAPR